MTPSTPAPDIITSFTGQHAILSPTFAAPLIYRDEWAPTLAHHYYAQQAPNATVSARIREAPTAASAQRILSAYPTPAGWEQHTRSQVMDDLLRAKFHGPALSALLKTGTSLLLPSTHTHEQFWGTCLCSRHRAWPGKNRLGKALMRLRQEHQVTSDTPVYTRVSLTGHRPKDLSDTNRQWVHDTLPWVIDRLRLDHAAEVAISGMAVGSDTMWAQMTLAAGMRLWAYMPYEQQTERWAPAERKKHRALRAAASYEYVLGRNYDVRLFHARNATMVRDSDLVVAIHHADKHCGGTAATIRKARQTRTPLLHLDLNEHKVVLYRGPDRQPTLWNPAT